MGNAESQPVRNVDKRTARRDHAPKFAAAVTRFKESRQVLRSSLDEGVLHAGAAGSALRVCVRRRPIFPHETSAGEFDVLSTRAGTGGTDELCVHNCRMHADCRRHPPARCRR